MSDKKSAQEQQRDTENDSISKIVVSSNTNWIIIGIISLIAIIVILGFFVLKKTTFTQQSQIQQATSALPAASKNSSSFNTQQTLLLTIPSKCHYEDGNNKTPISADGYHAAWDCVDWLTAHDSVVINGGKEFGPFPEYSIYSLILDNFSSPHSLFYGNTLAFISNTNNNLKFFYGDKIIAANGENYAVVGDPAVSEDGRHYAFFGDSYLIVDGKKNKVSGHDIVMNKDGSKLAYITLSNNKAHVVYNGVSEKDYDMIDSLVMSPDGNRIAYLVENNEKKNNNRYWVVDGHEYSNFEALTTRTNAVGATQLIFSPNSKKFSFTALSPSNPSQMVAVENGTALRPYDSVYTLAFNKNGSSLAYFATNGKHAYIMVNDTLIPINYPKSIEVQTNTLVLPSNNMPIYKIYDFNIQQYMLIINGKKSLPYTQIYQPSLSQDGNYLGYGVLKEGELWWMTNNLNQN